MFELAFSQPVPGYVPTVETTAALRSAFQEHIVGLVAEWAEANNATLKRAAIIARTRIYWSALHGLVTLERAGHAEPAETDLLIDLMGATLMDGWRAVDSQ